MSGRPRRRSQENARFYWYEGTVLPKRGDMGLYDIYHHTIARIVGNFKYEPPDIRRTHEREIRHSLYGICSILEAWHIDPHEDIRRTIKDLRETQEQMRFGFPRKRLF